MTIRPAAILRIAARALALLLLASTLLACALHVSNSAPAEPEAKPAGALRMATWNVHYIRLRAETGPWSVGDWQVRRDPMDAAFKAVDADIIAFQEMESFAGGSDGSTNLALDFLLDRNPGYSAAAVGDWREFPSTQPILYRDDALTLLDQGWFFFSDTPDVIYSRTFNGSWPAFASWATFRTDTGQRFHVYNVHFEYRSRSNRLLSAELVAGRITPRVQAGETVFLLGDLNAMRGTRTMEILQQAGLDFAPVNGATYHFDRGINLFGAIDHLSATEGVQLLGAPVIVQRKFQGEWPADHYPVHGDYRLP